MEIALAVFATFEFVENAILEGAKALGTSETCTEMMSSRRLLMNSIQHLHETLCMPQFAIGIDNFLMRLESFVTPRTVHIP